MNELSIYHQVFNYFILIEEFFCFNSDSNSLFEYTINEKINRITFKIILSSSNDNNDDNAWQKAQLFRQSTEQTSNDDQSHFLKINATIVKRNSK
jgi:hypothetical protein